MKIRMPSADPGIILFAHGSRVESANDAVRRAANDLACTAGNTQVEAAFLELGQPDLEGAVARLVDRGVRDMVVVPYFLTPGIHLERDLPGLVSAACKSFPEVTIRVAKPLDGHPALTGILLDRVREAD